MLSRMRRTSSLESCLAMSENDSVEQKRTHAGQLAGPLAETTSAGEEQCPGGSEGFVLRHDLLVRVFVDEDLDVDFSELAVLFTVDQSPSRKGLRGSSGLRLNALACCAPQRFVAVQTDEIAPRARQDAECRLDDEKVVNALIDAWRAGRRGGAPPSCRIPALELVVAQLGQCDERESPPRAGLLLLE